MSPLMAQSGHYNCADECPLSEVKQTSLFDCAMSAYDSKRTLIVGDIHASAAEWRPRT
jgi:hypothetical protein